MTPQQLRTAVLDDVGEPEAIFHLQEEVQIYLQHAEQLLGMLRAFTEKTLTMNLQYNAALYAIHNYAFDFIYPLRVSILKKQLQQTTFARIVDRDPQWTSRVGTPEQWFMVGCTHIGFYPTSPSTLLQARIIYIAQPPIPQDSGTFMVAPEWHETLENYASAILLAKEQKYNEAKAQMQIFFDRIGVARDPRFDPAETKGPRNEIPLHPSVEVPTE